MEIAHRRSKLNQDKNNCNTLWMLCARQYVYTDPSSMKTSPAIGHRFENKFIFQKLVSWSFVKILLSTVAIKEDFILIDWATMPITKITIQDVLDTANNGYRQGFTADSMQERVQRTTSIGKEYILIFCAILASTLINGQGILENGSSGIEEWLPTGAIQRIVLTAPTMQHDVHARPAT